MRGGGNQTLAVPCWFDAFPTQLTAPASHFQAGTEGCIHAMAMREIRIRVRALRPSDAAAVADHIAERANPPLSMLRLAVLGRWQLPVKLS